MTPPATPTDRDSATPDVGTVSPVRDDVCAVVLAAGEGRRLRPLTAYLPKALCPVGNVPLLDRALDRMAALGFAAPDTVAVNACYLGEQVVRQVGDRARLSVEPGDPLGTAGGVANLRDWIDGRGVLVGNADAYLSDPAAPPGPDVAALLTGWNGRTVRLLARPVTGPAQPGDFGGHRFAGLSLLPWARVRDLPVEPAELVRAVWRPAEGAGELEVVPFLGTYLDTGTPADYLAANLHAAAGRSLVDPTAEVTGRHRNAVIGAGAVVRGTLDRCVVWPGGLVHAEERLSDAIRVGATLTVRAGTVANPR